MSHFREHEPIQPPYETIFAADGTMTVWSTISGYVVVAVVFLVSWCFLYTRKGRTEQLAYSQRQQRRKAFDHPIQTRAPPVDPDTHSPAWIGRTNDTPMCTLRPQKEMRRRQPINKPEHTELDKDTAEHTVHREQTNDTAPSHSQILIATLVEYANRTANN
jgi:hypothetical protein